MVNANSRGFYTFKWFPFFTLLAFGVHFNCRELASVAAAGVFSLCAETQLDCVPMTRGNVRRSSGETLTACEPNCAEQLARFFPGVKAVRIPVRVTQLRTGNSKFKEATVMEFGAPQHAIFLSTLPLEFDDRVRIERDAPGRGTEAAVVAVQYHEGRKAVAVRFLRGPCNWVTET